MAKKLAAAAQSANVSTSTVAPVIPTAVAETNHADAVLAYRQAHPTAKPGEIAKALAEKGITISAWTVGRYLAPKKVKLDLAGQINLAKVFVKTQCDGKVADAVEAVEAVGKFVEDCGGAEGALAALKTYEAAVAALA